MRGPSGPSVQVNTGQGTLDNSQDRASWSSDLGDIGPIFASVNYLGPLLLWSCRGPSSDAEGASGHLEPFPQLLEQRGSRFKAPWTPRGCRAEPIVSQHCFTAQLCLSLCGVLPWVLKEKSFLAGASTISLRSGSMVWRATNCCQAVADLQIAAVTSCCT